MANRKISRPPSLKDKPIVIVLLVIIAVAGMRVVWWYLLEQQAPSHFVKTLADDFPSLSRIFPSLVNRSPNNTLTQKWVRFFNQDATFYTSPVLAADGTLYLATVQGRIIALDSSSATKWEYRTDAFDFVSGGMLLDREGNLYFTTLTKVYSLSPDGQQRWMTQCTPPKIYQSDIGSTIDGDVLYVECGHSFHALNKDVGSEIWSLPALDYESAVVARDGKIFTVRNQQIAVIGSDGVQLWTYPALPHGNFDPRRSTSGALENYIYTPLAFGADGTIFAGARMVNKIVAIDSQTGGLKWAFDAGKYAPFRSAPSVAADGTIYAQTMVGVAYAINPDGSRKWMYQMPQTYTSDLHAAPIIGDDGTVYFLAESMVVALSPEGHPVGTFGLSGPCAGSPVLSPDGILYIATLKGNVFAIRTASSHLMDAPWPKYQHDNSNSGRAVGLK